MTPRIFAALLIAVSACGTKNTLDFNGPVPGSGCAGPGTICTLGGHGIGDNGPVLSASLLAPRGWFMDGGGNLFIADSDHDRIRRVDTNGTISTVVGSGRAVFSNVQPGQLALDTPINSPDSVVADSSGWIYWHNSSQQRIFGVDPADGVVKQVAGATNAASAAVDGAALGATGFSHANGVMSVHSPGVVVHASDGTHVVQALNFSANDVTVTNVVVTAGTARIIAGTGTSGEGADGILATASDLAAPAGTTVLADGSVVISELGNNRIRQIDGTTGIITTIAGDASSSGFSGDGAAATAAELDDPRGMTARADGLLFFTDETNNRVRAVNTSAGPLTFGGVTIAAGNIDTVAGAGGTAGHVSEDAVAAAAIRLSLADAAPLLAPNGDLLVLDVRGVAYRVDSNSGLASIYAGLSGATTLSAFIQEPQSVATEAAGTLVVAAQTGHLYRYDPATETFTIIAGNGNFDVSGDGGAAIDAGFWGDSAAVAPDGTIVVGDDRNGVVRAIATDGTITTLAGIAGNRGVSGDQGPPANATFDQIDGVATDADSNVWVLGGGRIRLINRTGLPLTFGPTIVLPAQINTVAGNGASGNSGNGGQALGAQFNFRSLFNGLVVDGDRVFVADEGNNTIRVINRVTGIVDAFVGNGSGTGADGDGAPPLLATTPDLTGLAIADGYLYWSEETAIRRVSLSAGGVVERIAGTDETGFDGDGGRARDALLYFPLGIAATAGGTIVACERSHRVRQIVLE